MSSTLVSFSSTVCSFSSFADVRAFFQAVHSLFQRFFLANKQPPRELQTCKLLFLMQNIFVHSSLVSRRWKKYLCETIVNTYDVDENQPQSWIELCLLAFNRSKQFQLLEWTVKLLCMQSIESFALLNFSLIFPTEKQGKQEKLCWGGENDNLNKTQLRLLLASRMRESTNVNFVCGGGNRI